MHFLAVRGFPQHLSESSTHSEGNNLLRGTSATREIVYAESFIGFLISYDFYLFYFMSVVRTPVDGPLLSFSINLPINGIRIPLFSGTGSLGIRRIWDRVIGVLKSRGRVNLSRGNWPSVP